LDGFEVVSTELVGGLLEVQVRSTHPACCYHCGSLEVVGHGRNRRRLRDRSAAYPTVLVWQQRRFRCRDCGRTCREQHRAVAGAKRITARFLRHLGALATCWPWTDVAAFERVSWWRVASAFDLRAAGEPDYAGAPPPRVLSFDESAFRRGFRYHTVVSDPEGRGVLDLVEGRDQAACEQAISRLPEGPVKLFVCGGGFIGLG
jgi:transposase